MLNIVESTTSILTTGHGAGTHMWNVPLQNFFEVLYVRLIGIRCPGGKTNINDTNSGFTSVLFSIPL